VEPSSSLGGCLSVHAFMCICVCACYICFNERMVPVLLLVDTESSYGGGESPILMPRRRKSHSASCCLLGLTPGDSVESGNSTNLDIGTSVRGRVYCCSSNHVPALLALVIV
jgi:hypothetical protein